MNIRKHSMKVIKYIKKRRIVMNKKSKKKAIAATLAAALLVTGTFAWQSFSQLATNEILESIDAPGGRLHDYFNGQDKDVFIENYATGDNAPDVYARIRLAEYYEYGAGAGSLTASSSSMTIVRGDIENDSTPSILDPDTWDIYDYTASTESDIREYRALELGGSSIYMPTFN